jgi:hypothetical protein
MTKPTDTTSLHTPASSSFQTSDKILSSKAHLFLVVPHKMSVWIPYSENSKPICQLIYPPTNLPTYPPLHPPMYPHIHLPIHLLPTLISTYSLPLASEVSTAHRLQNFLCAHSLGLLVQGKHPFKLLYYTVKHEHRKTYTSMPTAGFEPNLKRHCSRGRLCALDHRGAVTDQ